MDNKDLYTALSKAQGEFGLADKDKGNPFFKSKYSTFQSIVEATRPALVKYGLSVSQVLQAKDDGQYLVTILGHSSGGQLESSTKLLPQKPDVQALGAYITYIKRYQYAAITGVVTSEDDDDGNRDANHRVPDAPVKISLDQLEQLEHELKGFPDIASMVLNKMKLSRLSDMPKVDFMSSINRIREIKDIRKNQN
jgi:ERF superfamily